MFKDARELCDMSVGIYAQIRNEKQDSIFHKKNPISNVWHYLGMII